MALYTLNELHNKTLETIQRFIQNDYKIVPSVYSNNKFIFITKLVDKHSPNVNLIIKTVQDDHKRTFTRQFIPASELCMPYEELLTLKAVYYLSYNDIYADSKEEAIDARNKFYAKSLGVDDTNNPIQAFADMLGKHLSEFLQKGVNK